MMKKNPYTPGGFSLGGHQGVVEVATKTGPRWPLRGGRGGHQSETEVGTIYIQLIYNELKYPQRG